LPVSHPKINALPLLSTVQALYGILSVLPLFDFMYLILTEKLILEQVQKSLNLDITLGIILMIVYINV
jgi:hypothetical protein